MSSNRVHNKGQRENENLCIDGSKNVGGTPSLKAAMSLEQLSFFLIKVATKSLDALKEVKSSLVKVWPSCGKNVPLLLGDFVAQVAVSAPESSQAQINLKQFSVDLGASGRSATQLVLGDDEAAKYTKGLQTAEDFGGYGGDGGAHGASSIARQNEGACAGLRMATAAVTSGSAHGLGLQEEGKKLKALDKTVLHDLEKFIPPPPSVGGDSRGDFSVILYPSHVSFNSIFDSWSSGKLIIFSGRVFKVVGFVEQAYQGAEGDAYENTVLALDLGTAKKVDEKLKGVTTELVGRLEGAEKKGVAYPYMPVVNGSSMSRLTSFVNFSGILEKDDQLASIYMKFNAGGSTENLENEWAPEKYQLLAYVDWDIAPKATSSKNTKEEQMSAKAASKKKKQDDKKKDKDKKKKAKKSEKTVVKPGKKQTQTLITSFSDAEVISID